MIVDQRGLIVVANAQAEGLFGYGAGELIGMSVERLLPAALRSRHIEHRASYAAAPHTRPMGSGMELMAQRCDGSTFAVAISLSSTPSESGPLVMAIVRDVTEHKRIEEQLEREAQRRTAQIARLEEQQRTLTARVDLAEAGMLQAARLAAIGQLAASLAHEINNPLYAARNSLYLLEQELAGQELPFLTIARDELSRIARVIEHMREFYRPAPGSATPCQLNELIERALMLVRLDARHSNVQVTFTVQPSLPPVLGDHDQLGQVLLNLTMNAIEAMPEGGELTVRTSSGPSLVIVEVCDTGVGIPTALRPRLFEPFFTSKPTGTGLGLSISAHIVTQHRGQIEVESEEGRGSTFRVALPRAMES